MYNNKKIKYGNHSFIKKQLRLETYIFEFEKIKPNRFKTVSNLNKIFDMSF